MSRILIADDARDIREMLGIALASADGGGHTIDFASNGQQALEMWEASRDENRPYSLVVTDFRMPILDGIELMARLPEDLPVIMATAADKPPYEFRKTPSRELVTKPFASILDFITHINELLESRRIQQP